MKEKYVVSPIPYSELNRIELNSWDKAQKVLEVLLSSNYQAAIVKCDNTYVIEYDWSNVEWSSNTLMWVDSDWVVCEDDND